MKKTAIACTLLGVLVAGSAQGGTTRYIGSGDYMDPAKWQGGLLPGTNDTVRFNWGSNTVTLAAAAPDIDRFQMGVDESGGLIVNSGGSLTALDTSKVGNNNDCTGFLVINEGGSVAAGGSWMMVAGNSSVTGILVLDGGTLDVNGHLWGATGAGSTATIRIRDGTLSVGAMLGLGTVNAVDPSGGTARLTLENGGRLALSNIHAAGTSIQPGSLIDIQGTGALTLPGDFSGVLANYVAAGRIVGNGIPGNVIIDLTTNPGFTTATADPGPVFPPATSLTLSARRTGSAALELAWPMGFGAFVVETTTNNPAAGGPWTILEAPVTLVSGQYLQIVTNDRARGFYRLVTAPTDNTTLHHKSMMGYQGWFSAPEDPSPVNDRWHHWGGGNPLITGWGIDFYPDMSEYTMDERYEPGWLLNNGATAYLYSAAHPKSVERHCRWMWDYQIDGVFLQRFLGEVQDPRFFTFRNMVTENLRAGAEKYSRLYAVMYDVSGVNDADMLDQITNDWNYLADTLDVTNSPSYLHHNGKPVVSIWGLGFEGRGLTPATATAIINYFRNEHGMTVMGGVPDSWRTLNGDSETDPAWADVYRSFDIISPWTVGRYSSLAQIDNWRVNKIEPDLLAATAAGADYMPVIFPGFSWYNIHDGPVNQIPRLGGEFYWRQAHNVVDAGCSMLYTAMFDEVDEGTAMFKLAETSDDLPAGATMVPLDADGISLPSDWYLTVAGEAGRMLRGEIPPQVTLPITP